MSAGRRRKPGHENKSAAMKVIQPNCRIQFTGEDIAFIKEAQGRDVSAQAALTDQLGG